jgi:DNA-binding GntR family transcriptional regulator
MKKTASKDIYGSIRDMILDFELYPGSRITETELAETFDVSRTPVRAALQRLEAEGYLTVIPKQGCFIREIDIDTLAQYYRVRQNLENLSLELAVTYMSDQELQALAREWDPAHQKDRSDNPDEMEARDEGFHIALAQGGGNLVLARYLNDLNRHIRVIRRLDFTENQRIDRTYQEHFEICQRLIRRDLAGAQAAMNSHITRSENFAKTLTLTQLAKQRHRRKSA